MSEDNHITCQVCLMLATYMPRGLHGIRYNENVITLLFSIHVQDVTMNSLLNTRTITA